MTTVTGINKVKLKVHNLYTLQKRQNFKSKQDKSKETSKIQRNIYIILKIKVIKDSTQ